MEYHEEYLYYWAIVGTTVETQIETKKKKQQLLATENSMLDFLYYTRQQSLDFKWY